MKRRVLPAVAAVLCLSMAPAMAQEHHHDAKKSANEMCFPSVSTGSVDRDFMLNMIPHHVMAVDMAKEELAHGTDPEARKLAESIIAAQQTEIEMMKKWVESHPQDGKK